MGGARGRRRRGRPMVMRALKCSPPSSMRWRCCCWSPSSSSRRSAGSLMPLPVAGAMVLGIAAVGLRDQPRHRLDAVPCGAHSASAHSALLHVLSDALGSVAAIVAGAVDPGDRLDADRSAAVAADRGAHSALDMAAAREDDRRPDGGRAFASSIIRRSVRHCRRLPGVTGVHDLHVWHMSARARRAVGARTQSTTARNGCGSSPMRSDADGALSHRSRDAAAVMAGGAGLWRSARHSDCAGRRLTSARLPAPAGAAFNALRGTRRSGSRS